MTAIGDLPREGVVERIAREVLLQRPKVSTPTTKRLMARSLPLKIFPDTKSEFTVEESELLSAFNDFVLWCYLS